MKSMKRLGHWMEMGDGGRWENDNVYLIYFIQTRGVDAKNIHELFCNVQIVMIL